MGIVLKATETEMFTKTTLLQDKFGFSFKKERDEFVLTVEWDFLPQTTDNVEIKDPGIQGSPQQFKVNYF